MKVIVFNNIVLNSVSTVMGQIGVRFGSDWGQIRIGIVLIKFGSQNKLSGSNNKLTTCHKLVGEEYFELQNKTNNALERYNRTYSDLFPSTSHPSLPLWVITTEKKPVGRYKGWRTLNMVRLFQKSSRSVRSTKHPNFIMTLFMFRLVVLGGLEDFVKYINTYK